MLIEDIIQAIKAEWIRITDHADEESQNDKLRFDEIIFSVLNGEIIEKYLKDKPYPSCLIFGMNHKNEPIHSVWAYNSKTKATILITVYRPNPKQWINWKRRRNETV
ncbi:MAG: DUF4258 domain-containing protein [Actinobacteria bacterium]|nr:DUF4258 domain-containing protein [Actinomycetota bacterium]